MSARQYIRKFQTQQNKSRHIDGLLQFFFRSAAVRFHILQPALIKGISAGRKPEFSLFHKQGNSAFLQPTFT